MDLLLHSCLLSEAMTASIILDRGKNIRRATEQNNLARRLLKGGRTRPGRKKKQLFARARGDCYISAVGFPLAEC